MVAKRFPTEWPALNVRPFESLDVAYKNTRDFAKSTDDLRVRNVLVTNDHADLLDAAAADIATNTADIATNTSDISDNTTDIGTNTTNITTNTDDITDLQADVANGGWTYGSQIATTSGTAVEIASGLPSSIVDLEVFLHLVSTNSDNQQVFLRLGDAGGYETTGYQSIRHGFDATATSQTRATSYFLLTDTASFDAVQELSGHLRFSRWDNAEHLWFLGGELLIESAGLNTAYRMLGHKTLSAVLEDVQISTVGGTATFDAGEARVRYR